MSKRVKETTALVAESVAKQSLSKTLPRTGGRSEIEMARIRHHTYAQLMDTVFKIFRTVARAGAFCMVAYFLYHSVEAITNKKTDFKLVIDSVIAVGANQWVAYAVAALCGVGYAHQRRLRKKTVESQGRYIQEIETKLDPKRSSSLLTDSGSSSKEDSDAI